MLSPLEKCSSGVNRIMQIAITTSCDLFTCSNCTQLLPFRQDYRHMKVSVVEQALQSVKEWPGVVALFGGNPCSHPQFPEIAEMLAFYIPEQERRGLWTNNYLGHGEVVRKVFYPNATFNLNVHRVVSAAAYMEQHTPGKVIPESLVRAAHHAPILTLWQDLGYSYEEWVQARETCDINQKWSGIVVERQDRAYGYFCEVAAALDGIRGLNHGIPAVPFWWKHPMLTFDAQVQNCCDKGCGVPLRLPGRPDNHDTYDISESFGEAARRSKTVNLQFHTKRPDGGTEVTDYMKVRS